MVEGGGDELSLRKALLTARRRLRSSSAVVVVVHPDDSESWALLRLVRCRRLLPKTPRAVCNM